MLWLPDVGLLPLQPPDAAHDAARELDHVNVLLPPALTVLGLAEIDTVGVLHHCAWAGGAEAAERITSASSAIRIGGFMGGDHIHNAAHTVCLQTATC